LPALVETFQIVVEHKRLCSSGLKPGAVSLADPTQRTRLPLQLSRIKNLLACSTRTNQGVRMLNTKIFSIAALSLGIAALCAAQTTSPASAGKTGGNSAPYTEGSVWTVTMIKTKAGLGDDYLKSISQTVKPVYDEEKKQKIILDYKILNGDASGPQDFSILIMVEYPNMAALDGLRDKIDPIIEKVMGSEDQRRATAVKRLDIREILGTKTMREITLK
jgi:hypothetical protein